ncbi:MAG: hypothetical protein ACFNX9_01210 [Eikenella corrodens]|uniref:hypothetical protein n=1 Tax=Eikenella corrodens TaxID=539 RepID=UPI0036087840
MQFQPIPCDTTGGILSATTDPRALHVLLRSPNLPTCNIVFDGDKYWFYNPAVGWDSRREFKGHIPTLLICATYSACTAGLPFKVRTIDHAYTEGTWENYLKSLA